MGKTKDLFGPCVRYGSMDWEETHPCFFCGFPIPVTIKYCKCGIIKCPKCECCACTISKEALDALITLRNRYCCNPINFALGINQGDKILLELVPHYADAFNYCRNLEMSKIPNLNVVRAYLEEFSR